MKASLPAFAVAVLSGSLAFGATITDDFTDGDYTANPTWNPVVGSWSVAAGELYSGIIGSGGYHLIQLDAPVDMASPYTLEADIKGKWSNANPGFALNIQDGDASDFYAIVVYASSQWTDLELRAYVDGAYTIVDTEFLASPPATEVFHTMSVDANGSTFTVNFDDANGQPTQVRTLSDPLARYSGGGIGLFAGTANSEQWFDNVSATFTEVPEPAAVAGALLASGGLLTRPRRRR